MPRTWPSVGADPFLTVLPDYVRDMTQPIRVPKTPLLLGLAGWIPFWIPVALATHAVATGRSAAAETALFIVYAAIILGFLGGVRWGQALTSETHQSSTFMISVVPSLAGLAAALLYWAGAPLTALALIFASLFMHWRWDIAAMHRRRLPVWYGRLRSVLTLGACSAAVAMLVLYPMSV